MNDQPIITDLFVTLRSGVRLRMQLSAHESTSPDFFDEENAIARQPDHLEVLEAAECIGAGLGERWPLKGGAA